MVTMITVVMVTGDVLELDNDGMVEKINPPDTVSLSDRVTSAEIACQVRARPFDLVVSRTVA